MLPHRLQMIRSLDIDVPLKMSWQEACIDVDEAAWPENILIFWNPAWSVISEMHGLRNLKVTLSSNKPLDIDWETLHHILQPMMAVKHVPYFALEMFLSLPERLLEDVLQSLGGNAPFSVEVKEHIHMPNAPPW